MSHGPSLQVIQQVQTTSSKMMKPSNGFKNQMNTWVIRDHRMAQAFRLWQVQTIVWWFSHLFLDYYQGQFSKESWFLEFKIYMIPIQGFIFPPKNFRPVFRWVDFHIFHNIRLLYIASLKHHLIFKILKYINSFVFQSNKFSRGVCCLTY